MTEEQIAFKCQNCGCRSFKKIKMVIQEPYAGLIVHQFEGIVCTQCGRSDFYYRERTIVDV